MSRSPMKRSTPRLSEVARKVVVPAGAVKSGWGTVEKKCLDLGIRFRWWQVAVGSIILTKRVDGKYAATIGGTGLSIPRQVGKTFLVGAIVFALCLLRPGLTVIWTAHRLRTAEETFGKMQAFAQRKKIAPHVAKLVLGSGEEEVRFVNGSRIMFGARERGFGRGFDEVDVVVFDEAQILTDSALDDMIPAMNQSRQPEGALMLFMGTPPKPADPSEVFSRMRREALSGEDEDTGWVEFGADADFIPTELPALLSDADWRQIAKANPSYPDDTPREAILRMRKKLGADSFLREGLGIWDEVAAKDRVVDPIAWAKLEGREVPSSDVAPIALALDRGMDGATSIAGGWRTDTGAHVELVAVDVTPDSERIVQWVAVRAGRRIPVLIAADSPAAALAPALRVAKVKVVLVNLPDYGKACIGFTTDIDERRLSHAGQAQVSAAMTGAKKRNIGVAGSWGWDRKSPTNDISPLVAVTLARLGAVSSKPKVDKPGGRKAVVL